MSGLEQQSQVDGFERFQTVFVQNWRKLAATMISLGAAPPILDLLFNIGSPWPHRTGVAFFTTVVLWIVLLWTYTVWKGISKARLDKRVSIVGLLTLLFLGTYIWLNARYVRDTISPSYQVVIGSEPSEKTQRVFADPANRGLSMHQWLQENNWEVAEVYDADNLALIRTAVLGSWLGMFGFLSALTSGFLLQFEKKTPG